MIDNIQYVIGEGFNPYYNLALEEYLLTHVTQGQCILYLWQNEKTVVIGKNQNAWKECKIKELEEDGGKLVRRLSGGGAVFHDLGNLNFTFLVNKEDYDVDKQLEVIIKAVGNLFISAVKTGRNDITVEGRKFSGNAFYSDGNHSYHHGTILIDVDMKNLSTYLNVSREKLISNGVESVKSRVINLKEYRKDLTIELMRRQLIQAFSQVYDLTPVELQTSNLDSGKIHQLSEKFSSWNWIFGKKMEFNYSFGRRFAWGDVELNFQVEGGVIKECVVYSDAMDTLLIEEIPTLLRNCVFSTEVMVEKLKILPDKLKMHKLFMDDMKQLIIDMKL